MILIGWRMLKGKPTYKKPLYLEVRTMVSRFPNQNYLHKPWDIQDLRSSDSWGVLDIINGLDAISCPGIFCCWSEGGNHRDPINTSNMGLKRHPLRSMILPEKKRGKLTVCYWTWPIYSWFSHETCWFSIVFLVCWPEGQPPCLIGWLVVYLKKWKIWLRQLYFLTFPSVSGKSFKIPCFHTTKQIISLLTPLLIPLLTIINHY